MQKYIPPINTKRLHLELHEMQIDDAEALCEIPAVYDQRTMTDMLRRIARSSDRPGAVADPRLWSTNERMFVTASYMAAVIEDGPNFAIGKGHFSDYLLPDTDFVAEVPFEFEGSQLVWSPMLGYQAEVIETLVTSGAYKPTDYTWWCAAMAACVRGADEEPIAYVDDATYEDVLKERITNIRALAESQFVGLFDAYIDAAAQGAHLVYAITSKHGVVAAQVSVPNQDTGVPELAPARFPAHSCISQRARQIMGLV